MCSQRTDEQADGVYEMSEKNCLPGIKPTDEIMRIPVFYTPNMVANFNSFSPSAGKPEQVVEAWQ